MNERIDHTRHEHSNTAHARKACRALHTQALTDARNEYVVNGETERYDDLVHRVALVWAIDVSAAYTLIEDGQA